MLRRNRGRMIDRMFYALSTATHDVWFWLELLAAVLAAVGFLWWRARRLRG